MSKNISKRLDKLEKAIHIRDIPPLFVSSYNSDEVLGFREGSNTVMRLEHEDIKTLQERALKTLKREPGAIMLVAICKSWGNGPSCNNLIRGEK